MRDLVTTPRASSADIDAAEHAWLMERMTGARIAANPFPHLYVDNFLPPGFYERLVAAWPPESAFRANKNRQKLDLVPTDAYADKLTDPFKTLPVDMRTAWRSFAQLNRAIVGPWLASLFEDHIRERIALLQRLIAEGKTDIRAAGLAAGTVQANVGRLMMRGQGYTLAPHVDPAYYLVTALHYFAEDADEGYGTRLFRASRPMPLEAFVKDGTTEYFEPHGIAVTEAACLPFRPNSFLAFPNLLDAAHGVVAPSSGYRKAFQYHLSLKADHEPL
jgi:hypothetical protein